jgi:sensor domain CHASE-containing protein
MDGSETQIINDSHLVENVQENNDKSNDSLNELIGLWDMCFRNVQRKNFYYI